jgi:hypothetical protein
MEWNGRADLSALASTVTVAEAGNTSVVYDDEDHDVPTQPGDSVQGRMSKRTSVRFAAGSFARSWVERDPPSQEHMDPLAEVGEENLQLYQRLDLFCDRCRMGPGAAEAWMQRFQRPFEALAWQAGVEGAQAAAVAAIAAALGASQVSPSWSSYPGSLVALCTLLAAAMACQAWNLVIVWEQGPVQGYPGIARATVAALRMSIVAAMWLDVIVICHSFTRPIYICNLLLALLLLASGLTSVSEEIQNLDGGNVRITLMRSRVLQGCMNALQLAGVGAQALLLSFLADLVRFPQC